MRARVCLCVRACVCVGGGRGGGINIYFFTVTCWNKMDLVLFCRSLPESLLREDDVSYILFQKDLTTINQKFLSQLMISHKRRFEG